MSQQGLSDEELMERFRSSSDTTAFNQLVLRYYRSAVCVATGLLGRNGLTAEDAVQEAFVRVARAKMRFDSARSFAAWFFSILRNVCIDLLRSESRRRVFLGNWAREKEYESQPEVFPAEGLGALLSVLEPVEREILLYRVVHGMTFREIGVQVGCSEEAAKKRAQRALRRLRQHLREGHRATERPISLEESGLPNR